MNRQFTFLSKSVITLSIAFVINCGQAYAQAEPLKMNCSAAVINLKNNNEVENYPDQQVQSVEIYDGAGLQPKTKINFSVQTPDGELSVSGIGYAMVTTPDAFEANVEVSMTLKLAGKNSVGETIALTPNYEKKSFDLSDVSAKVKATHSFSIGKVDPKTKRLDRQYTASCKVSR